MSRAGYLVAVVIVIAAALIACDSPLPENRTSPPIQEVMTLCRKNGGAASFATVNQIGSVTVKCVWRPSATQ